VVEGGKWCGVVFSVVGFGPLVPVKLTLNASVYQDILDNVLLPTLWEQFGDAPVHRVHREQGP